MSFSINKYSFIFIALFLIGQIGYSQTGDLNIHPNPPINTEILLGNRGANFQMIINKGLKTAPKFGIFAVTNLVAEWNTNQVSDHMTQASLTFEITKGLKVGAGFHLTPITGIRPSGSLMYSFANKEWLLVVNSRVDLSQDINVEGLSLIEYKPKITEKIRFYSRIQSLYSYNTSIQKHSRSYVFARAGITLNEFSFGIGGNMDYYGPLQHNENNVGVFVNCLLF